MKLLDRLREVVADERDLEAVLSFAAGGVAQFGSAGAIDYLTATPRIEVFARVKFKHGRISSIAPGHPLLSIQAQDALVERARTETAHNHGSFVVSRVLFSQYQLDSIYLWNDEVRISPCPATAIIGKGLDWFNNGRPSNLGGGHLGPPFPFLLEVRIQRSPNPFLESNRTLRQLDAYQYLFTLLLMGHTGFAHWPSGRLWTIMNRGDLTENNLVYPGFSINENGRNDDFPVREHGPARVFEGGDYYNHLWPQGSQLQFPSSLDADLKLFQSLPREMANTFVRACYWYALGIQFRSEHSLATVAFSSAVECLLPRTTSSRCKECGKPLGLGPTQLFNRHVKRYGTVIAALHGRRKSLYDVRSALVHGSHASHVDIDFMSAHRHAEDHLLLLEIVSQRSLINWLRDAERETWHISKGADHGCVD